VHAAGNWSGREGETERNRERKKTDGERESERERVPCHTYPLRLDRVRVRV